MIKKLRGKLDKSIVCSVLQLCHYRAMHRAFSLGLLGTFPKLASARENQYCVFRFQCLLSTLR